MAGAQASARNGNRLQRSAGNLGASGWRMGWQPSCATEALESLLRATDARTRLRTRAGFTRERGYFAAPAVMLWRRPVLPVVLDVTATADHL